ncbi:response regulator [Faecalibacterium duncaniae]|uniref:response regulator n=1 Tax=Faecalibacterium duncaniae (strain DSM 17677 / JCM 31915 / A2-165) TaxID=411483 RepID=UPI002940A4DE|nr:response regulator [Faecalibacterium duncaniae]MDV5093039.1 response regulator [Faecalibacterium duncaniae]
MKFDRRLTDEIYTSDTVRLGKNAFQAMRETVYHNGGVGTITGYYDAELSILSVSDLLLHNLNHSYASLMEQTKGSLKNLFYKKDATFLDNARFRQIQGGGEGQILTADGSPVYVRLYKKDAVDTDGTPIWILSVQMNWAYENLALVNESIHSALWYFECNENDEIVHANWSHAFRQLLGYHDILDFPNKLDSWSNLLHPEDHDRVMQLLLETIADKTNTTKYNVEYRLKMQDGQYQWFRASAEVIRRLDGSANRIAGIISNIDAEKRSRMQAQRAAAFHRAFTSANLCEYYVNLEKNTFDAFKVEPSLMTAFEQNHTWDGLVRFFVDNYVVEEDKKSVTNFYNRAYITEKLKGLETELRQECRIVLDGEERWVSNVVMRGEIEDSEYAMIFLRDITESKAETARRMQMASDNASIDLLIKSMVRLLDRFVVCDLENDRYRFYNLQGDMIYAPTGAYHDFVEQVAAKYKTLEPLDALAALFSPENIRKNLQDENDIYKFEYCSMDENTYKIASIIPLEWDGTKLVKALLASMDVSQEKKAEIESHKALKEAYRAAENASRAKTEFLSNMSHDIRTPMNAIVGLTAIAGANIESQDRVVECLGKITKSSRHLLGLINEVLDMARIESGRISLAEEDFSLPELVDNLLTLTKPAIDEHHHQLEVHIEHIEHEAVCGDSLRIQQVFVNLMSNAVKYTPDGGNITLTIKEKPNGFSKLGCYEFSIEDNGIGMTPEFQKIMFEPFSRADDHRTTKVQGTGLGMAIARNIVNLMNGDIQVESAPNKGTKITVTVYLKLQENEKEQEKELLDLPVLVVDDDKTCCESTVATLQEIGIAGEWVLTGKEAVERCAARHKTGRDYFAVILDWKMPEIDGIATARKIRERVGEDVTIIILTSFDFSEIEEEARAAGVNAFMAKPLFRSRLTATLRQFTSGKKEKNARNYLEDFAKENYAGKRILLVEDNELNREIATEIIGMTGVTIDSAENGKIAVEKVMEAPEKWYDLIFMDIQMPIMNGYEATAAIRALAGSRGKVPIIAMTANAFAEDVQLAKNTGMNEHIAKPLDLNKLNDVLKQWL